MVSIGIFHTGGMMNKSRLEEQFALAWRIYGNGAEYEREYMFAADIGRKFRFDFCWVDAKVAVECDGGQYAFRGGRHATDKDRWKLNYAAALNWRVLRFSGTMLQDPEKCCELVRWALETMHT